METKGTKTLFMVRFYSDSIYQLDVEKESEKCVWYWSVRKIENTRFSWDSTYNEPLRVVKKTESHRVFVTVEECVNHIRERYRRKIEAAESTARWCREQLTEFEKVATVLLQN